MKVFSPLAAIAVTAAALISGGNAALAGMGQPSPWQMGLQDSATPIMSDITWFHDVLLWITAVISGFVLLLLLIIILRFNARANPTPTRTTHNTLLEVLWTILPVIILACIAVPSFRLLFVQLDVPKPDLTVKATGSQWYWTYNYPDNGNLKIISAMLDEEHLKQLKPDEPRLLAVDNDMVVPVNKVVHVIVTGTDVIHSFNVPSFGIRIDAVPGRINETWFKATTVGMFYGQCSELCGKDHSFMPIAVKVVSDADFAAWLAQQQHPAAENETGPRTAVAVAGVPSR
jgi:cytochrome c oxidase subunit 2